MNKATIIKSPNGDTRTAKGDVSFEEFQKANDMHIKDVSNIMNSLAKMIQDTGKTHDWTKKEREKQFYEEFTDARKNDKKFTEMDWYKNHIKDERHHIKDHCPDDVDLIDVLEMITDSTAAALARSGGLKYPLEIDKDVLYKAFENTCKMVLDACELKDE